MVYEVLNEELYTISEENIKRVYDVIDVEKELDVISQDVLKRAIYFKDGFVYIGNDKVVPKISKNGSVYFMLRGEIYIKTYSIRKAILKMLIDNGFTYIKDVARLPKFQVQLLKSGSGKEYLCWFNNQEEPIMLYTKEKGVEKLEKQLTSIEYQMLKEELSYSHHIETEPILPEPDEIYGSKEPELFVEKIAELKEAISVVLEMQQRKISADERILAIELKEELENLLG